MIMSQNPAPAPNLSSDPSPTSASPGAAGRPQGSAGGSFGWRQSNDKPVNVASNERWLSAVGGGALALYGLKHGGLSGTLLALLGGPLIYRGVTGHCHGYAALGINTAQQGGQEARGPARPQEYFERGIHVAASVTVNKDPAQLYAFWRRLDNLPRFMRHLESVTVKDQKTSHWVAKAPVGTSVSWDAEIINDEPDALIAWRSLGGATVDNAGSVRFVPGPDGRGTQVKVVLDYIPPAGQIGAAVAKLFGEDPQTQVQDDLRRFKQLMETGEIPTTQGQPSGRK
jgi:uncharacterized membrane protein